MGQGENSTRAPSAEASEALCIEDYALIGDCLTGALVGRNGSIDWLCWPRLDSDACFAALLGSPRHGRWQVSPVDASATATRSYRGDTMVLETRFETADGSVALIDFMPFGKENSSVVRRVEGRRARVRMRLHLTMRFDYGSSTPWVTHLETIWDQPDDGICEIRGGRRQFTHSRVMAWVAVDRSIRDAEAFDVPAPLDPWRALRDQMHAEICAKGYDPERKTFTQSFGSPELDAALLLIRQVGFLPPDDKRVIGTVEAIERELLVDGFVLRYRTEAGSDGLPPGEGAFLPCSFWLVNAYALIGRHADAEASFERLGQLANDVGLLAEEYDPKAKRQIGNFPQAFSHLALVEAALQLRGNGSPARS